MNQTIIKLYRHGENVFEETDKIVRDFTSVVPRSKSELRTRINNILSQQKQEILKKQNELLLDQLYRFEGVLGKYNCQQGGRNCEFQIACHRLLREEIENLKK